MQDKLTTQRQSIDPLTQNFIHEEIKNILNSLIAYYHSVQKLLPSCLLSKSLKIKIHKTIVVYGCETWSLILREEHRLKVFENRMKRISGPKCDEIIGRLRKVHNEELHS
jgi:hypothetical protein